MMLFEAVIKRYALDQGISISYLAKSKQDASISWPSYNHESSVSSLSLSARHMNSSNQPENAEVELWRKLETRTTLDFLMPKYHEPKSSLSSPSDSAESAHPSTTPFHRPARPP